MKFCVLWLHRGSRGSGRQSWQKNDNRVVHTFVDYVLYNVHKRRLDKVLHTLAREGRGSGWQSWQQIEMQLFIHLLIVCCRMYTKRRLDQVLCTLAWEGCGSGRHPWQQQNHKIVYTFSDWEFVTVDSLLAPGQLVMPCPRIVMLINVYICIHIYIYICISAQET